MMIRSLLRFIGIWPYLKYLKSRFFPSAGQLEEARLIPERLSFYSQFIGRGDLCFDIGANIGNRTNIFLLLGARVVAIEPQHECAKLLKLRFGNKITLLEEAVGKSEDVGTLFVSETSEISSMSRDWIESVSTDRFKDKKWSKKEKVTITTLDKVIDQNGLPKFCKIDVEGFEGEVFKGLSQAISYLSFEYTIPEKINSIWNCLDRLSQLGQYDCNCTIGEQMQFEFSDWVSKAELVAKIKKLSSTTLFGDIYVRFQNHR
jgi:FkbM family methyltransferase